MITSLLPALLFLLQSVLHIAMLLLVCRFLLQLAKANYYNPVTQLVIKATKPLLWPLQAVLPRMFTLDCSPLVLAWLIALALIGLLHWSVLTVGMVDNAGLIFKLQQLSWLQVGLSALASVCMQVVSVYFWSVILVALSSWIQSLQRQPLVHVLHELISPLLNPVRRYLPANTGIDFSPIIVLLGLQTLMILLKSLTLV